MRHPCSPRLLAWYGRLTGSAGNIQSGEYRVAPGMTPLQLGGMITLQTSVIGLLSGLAAVPLGLVMAYSQAQMRT